MNAQPLPWRRLLVLSGAGFATVTTELLPASLLPRLATDLHVTEATAGLLVTGWALTVAAVGVLLAPVAGRAPRAVMMPLLLLVVAAATAGTALAPTYAGALAGRMLAAGAHGVFWSLLIPTVAAAVAPHQVGRAIAVVSAGPAAASVVGIPLGSAVGSAVGWRPAFAALAVLLAGAAVAVRRLHLPDAPPPSGGARAGRVRDLRRVGAVATGGALILIGHFMVYTYVAVLLRERGGFGAEARSGLLLVFGVAGLAGIGAAGWLSDRYPARALGAVAVAFAAGLAALVLVAGGTPAAVTVIVVWGALIGVMPPVFQTRLMRIAPPGARTAAGGLGITVLNLGIAAGAATGGFVLDRWGAGPLPLAATAVTVLAALALVVEGSLPVGAEDRVGDAVPVPSTP